MVQAADRSGERAVTLCRHCKDADHARLKYTSVSARSHKWFAILTLLMLTIGITMLEVGIVLGQIAQLLSAHTAEGRDMREFLNHVKNFLGTIGIAALLAGVVFLAEWIRGALIRNASTRFYAYMGDGSEEDLQLRVWHVHLTYAGLKPGRYITLATPESPGCSKFLSWNILNTDEILKTSVPGDVQMPVVRIGDVDGRCVDITKWDHLLLVGQLFAVATILRTLQLFEQRIYGIPQVALNVVLGAMQQDKATRQSVTVGGAWQEVLRELADVDWRAVVNEESVAQEVCERVLRERRSKRGAAA